jgi:hypothetical protein
MNITVFWDRSSPSTNMSVALYWTTEPHILGNSKHLHIPGLKPLQSSTHLAEGLYGFPQPLQADAAEVPLNKPLFQIPFTIHKDLSISSDTIMTKLISPSSNAPEESRLLGCYAMWLL